jgi:hypothetical protein
MNENAMPVCKCLRSKGFYLTGAQDADLVEFSPTSAYWCLHTVTVLGPDDILCSPEMCQPGRSCFEAR